jgi:hypothetical protein
MSLSAEDLHPMTAAQWESLVRFGDDVPVPDAGAWSGGRAALARAIDEELASLGTSETPALLPESTIREAQRPGGLIQHKRRIVFVASALGVAASLVALGIVFVGGPARSIPSASAALYEAASNTVGNSPVPGPGQYLVLHERFQIQGVQLRGDERDFNFDIPGSGEWWIPRSGEGEDQVSMGQVVFPTSSDRTKWLAAGSPRLAPSGVLDEQFPLSPAQQQAQAAEQGVGALPLEPTVLTQSQVASLPTDPTELKGVLVEEYLEGYRDPGTLFDLAASLLEEGASSAQRSALFKMVSFIPGVSSVGKVATDVTGQRGTAVTLNVNGFTHEMIFDPTTSTVLEEKTSQNKGPSSSPPTEISGSAEINETLEYTIFQAPGLAKSEPTLDLEP